LSELIDIQKT